MREFRRVTPSPSTAALLQAISLFIHIDFRLSTVSPASFFRCETFSAFRFEIFSSIFNDAVGDFIAKYFRGRYHDDAFASFSIIAHAFYFGFSPDKLMPARCRESGTFWASRQALGICHDGRRRRRDSSIALFGRPVDFSIR